MGNTKKPRKVYRPRACLLDNMAYAREGACLIPRQDTDDIMRALGVAIKAMREGVATMQQWSVIAGTVEFARAIERQGVVRGLHGHIELADDAMASIHKRAMVKGGGKWAAPTLYFQEIDALSCLSDLHHFQLRRLGKAEMLSALKLAQAHIEQQGHTVHVATNLAAAAA